jgi:tyrosine-protein kinase Etk/Wzc
VFDTPPLFPLADALILGHQADGVVLCVRAGDTLRPRAVRACEALRQNQSRILGVVLNALPENMGGYDEGYGLYEHRPRDGAAVPASASPALTARLR